MGDHFFTLSKAELVLGRSPELHFIAQVPLLTVATLLSVASWGMRTQNQVAMVSVRELFLDRGLV